MTSHKSALGWVWLDTATPRPESIVERSDSEPWGSTGQAPASETRKVVRHLQLDCYVEGSVDTTYSVDYFIGMFNEINNSERDLW